MSELEGLKNRVEQAVEQLSTVQNARHDQIKNLTNLLGNLEEKFKARTVELDYCNSQIESLTQDNAQLSELVERLVNLIESGPKNAEDDPLIRASTMAATLLKGWSGGEAAAALGADVPETNDIDLQQNVALSFEDVSDDELKAEALDAPEGEVSELVANAIAAAQNVDDENYDAGEAEFVVAQEEVAQEVPEDEAMEEPVAADIEIPESEFHAEVDPDVVGFAGSVAPQLDRKRGAEVRGVRTGDLAHDHVHGAVAVVRDDHGHGGPYRRTFTVDPVVEVVG